MKSTTTKSFIKLFFGLLFIFSFTAESFSATYTFVGGNRSWSASSSWDLPGIPSSNDDVYIPYGVVRVTGNYKAECKSLVVASPAQLRVFNGSQLEMVSVLKEDGIRNFGRVDIYGALFINDIIGSAYQAIDNRNRFYVFSTGEVEIENVDGKGIFNAHNANFYNYGSIEISDTRLFSIDNRSSFKNSGDLIINNASNPTAIWNQDYFDNDGLIDAISAGGGVFRNVTSNSVFHNYGNCLLENSIGTASINNRGTITNHKGQMSLRGGGIGLLNTSIGTFNNEALLTINWCTTAIDNYGDFVNTGSVRANSAITIGIKGRSNSSFLNHDYIYFTNNTSSLILDGHFVNSPTGLFVSDKEIRANKYSLLENLGMMTTYSGGTHYVWSSANWINEGVIYCNNSVPNNITNNQLVIEDRQGPYHVNTPVPNFFRIGGLNNVTIKAIYTNPYSLVSAGSYDPNTNVFTPNSNAVGLNVLYVHFTFNGINRKPNFDVFGGIKNFAGKDPVISKSMSLGEETITGASMRSADNDLRIFPNPSNGLFNVDLDEADITNCKMIVTNLNGQTIYESELEDSSVKIDLSHLNLNGMFNAIIISDNKIINQELIMISEY